jgi:formylglycine-generating enzyme required for sulfatase activity
MPEDLRNAIEVFTDSLDKDWHYNILMCRDVYLDAGYDAFAEACETAQRLLSRFKYPSRRKDELRMLELDHLGIAIPKKYKYVKPHKSIPNKEDWVELVWIPPGTFIQGVEPTQVPIVMNGFYLQTDVVVQKLWVSLMGENPSNNQDPTCWETLPVENISWFKAEEFINKLNEYIEENGKFCFLKDYQCEYAFRAMTTTPYTFGENAEDFFKFGWAKENSDGHTHPVKQLRPNLFGLYDVNGNTWEWGDDKEAEGSYKSQYDAIPEENRLPLEAADHIEYTDIVRGIKRIPGQ